MPTILDIPILSTFLVFVGSITTIGKENVPWVCHRSSVSCSIDGTSLMQKEKCAHADGAESRNGNAVSAREREAPSRRARRAEEVDQG
jgi:hypothetical protein